MKANSLFLLLTLAAASQLATAQDKPNVLLVFLDNFGWGEPGFNGGGIVRGAETPKLDRLAASGLRLTNFNVEVQCTPSRSAIMTGRYAIRSGNSTVPLGEGVYADNGPEALSDGETSLTVETSVHGSAGPWRSTLFTGYEGALRVPFAIRWPGKIEPGRVSNEIVHEMDLYPTLAQIVGGKVPQDRPIDGIDMSKVIVGGQEKSGRESFIVYMGNDVFGVKWRNWKLHFKEQTGWNGVLREYTMPRVYNLMNDPQERDNVLFPHTWVPKAALPQLEAHVASLKMYPPIPTGTPDPYRPPN